MLDHTVLLIMICQYHHLSLHDNHGWHSQSLMTLGISSILRSNKKYIRQCHCCCRLDDQFQDCMSHRKDLQRNTTHDPLNWIGQPVLSKETTTPIHLLSTHHDCKFTRIMTTSSPIDSHSLYETIPTDLVIHILSYLEINIAFEQGFSAVLNLYGRRRHHQYDSTPQLLFRTARIEGKYLAMYPVPDQPGCLYMIDHVYFNDSISSATEGQIKSWYKSIYCARIASWKHCHYQLSCADLRDRNTTLPVYARCIGLLFRTIEANKEVQLFDASACLDHIKHARFYENKNNPFYCLDKDIHYPNLRSIHVCWETVSAAMIYAQSAKKRWIAYSARLFRACPNLRLVHVNCSEDFACTLMDALMNNQWCLPDHVTLHIGTYRVHASHFLTWAYSMPLKRVILDISDRYPSIHKKHKVLLSFPHTRFCITGAILISNVQQFRMGYHMSMEPLFHDRQRHDCYSEFISEDELCGVRITIRRSAWLRHLDERLSVKVHIQFGDTDAGKTVLMPLTRYNAHSGEHKDDHGSGVNAVLKMPNEVNGSIVPAGVTATVTATRSDTESCYCTSHDSCHSVKDGIVPPDRQRHKLSKMTSNTTVRVVFPWENVTLP